MLLLACIFVHIVAVNCGNIWNLFCFERHLEWELIYAMMAKCITVIRGKHAVEHIVSKLRKWRHDTVLLLSMVVTWRHLCSLDPRFVTVRNLLHVWWKNNGHVQVIRRCIVLHGTCLLSQRRVKTVDGPEVHACLFAGLHTVHVHAIHGSHEWRRKSSQPADVCH